MAHDSKQVNEYLIKHFPKAEDALMVEQYLANELYSGAVQFLLRGKEADLIAWIREQRTREEAALGTTR